MGYENNGANNNSSSPYQYLGSTAHALEMDDKFRRQQASAQSDVDNAYATGFNDAVIRANARMDVASDTIRRADSIIIELRATVAQQAARIADLDNTVKEAGAAIDTWEVYSGKLRAALVTRNSELEQSQNQVTNFNDRLELAKSNDLILQLKSHGLLISETAEFEEEALYHLAIHIQAMEEMQRLANPE